MKNGRVLVSGRTQHIPQELKNGHLVLESKAVKDRQLELFPVICRILKNLMQCRHWVRVHKLDDLVGE